MLLIFMHYNCSIHRYEEQLNQFLGNIILTNSAKTVKPFQFPFRSLILNNHFMSRTTSISRHICRQSGQITVRVKIISRVNATKCYISFNIFMYRNDFGVNEHGSLGRIIYQWKNVLYMQTTGIQEHLCSKVKSVNHSA